MSRGLLYKGIFILVVLLGCVYGVIEVPRSKDEMLANIQKRIHLGLDLRGGSHLILQVQVQDAIRAQADSAIERLKTDLNRQNISFTSVDRNDPQKLEQADTIQVNLKGIPPERSGDFKAVIDDRFPDWIYSAVDSTSWRLTMKPASLVQVKRDTMSQSIQTLTSRIDGLGLTEPSIQQRGRDDADFEISVQFPGVDDPARVRSIMQTTALLELKEVKAGPYASLDAAIAAHGGILPPDSDPLKFTERGDSSQAPVESWYILGRTPIVTGRDLRTAREAQDQVTRSWETGFSLSVEAGQRFARYTEAHIGQKLSVVLDRRIRNVATIESRIADQGRITNQRSQQEASDLALVLRAGSLPASILVLEEHTVGASLGADSIRQGVISGLAGLVAVVLAMLIYYKAAGVNAVAALVMNVVILMAALGYFGPTLTLPGIAGVILGIGMAVDSNVLIFERIREELRAGKTVVGAVDAGFNKAFLTIIDTHVTTIVSACFLFIFGTGPVRGFAVTLVIGLMANIFTAVFVSRVMFDFLLSRRQQVTELSI
jgi:preprotein translocase subunit SecD